MDNAGRSILWFLVACLGFTEAAISFVAKSKEDLGGVWVLLFAFLCLVTVLVTLLRMFQLNPAFITAERGDVVKLALIQRMTREYTPEMLKHILNLKAEVWKSGEPDVDDAEAAAPVEEPADVEPDEEPDEAADDGAPDEEFAEAFAALTSDETNR